MRNRLQTIQALLGALAVALLAGCGSSNSGTTTAVVTTSATSCSTGYIYSSTYGCLPQSSCPSGYGLYNNQCVLVTTGTTCDAGYVFSSTYGCLPQSGCGTGYALYNGQCIYVGSTTISCPTGYVVSGNQCIYSTSTTTSSCQGSCQAGYTQTVYGCLPQQTCGSCFGYYNRYCLGGAPTGYLWYLTPY